ncbi:MAG: hypothetical protein JSS28_07000 [Proteobacteria bacterium]|nr:hypothetical protein [Pseudomonadota bacterium]
MNALLGRILIYLVVIPLALIAIVPNSLDTLHLLRTGDITLEDVVPSVARLFRKTPEAPRVDAPFAAEVEDLGGGQFKLAYSASNDKISGTAMYWRLRELAENHCAKQLGVPNITNASQYNSHYYNDASLKFECYGTVDTNHLEELQQLENRLLALRVQVGDAMEKLDDAQRAAIRRKFAELGARDLAIRKLGGQERLRQTSVMIDRHAALLQEVMALKK